MRNCTIEECQAEQCAPNNPYLCVRRTNGIIDGPNSACYTSIPQNLPSDCDFCDMSECGINPVDNCAVQCKTNSGQFCPNGISCDALPLSNCSTINGELHCCCDAPAPGPRPGPAPGPRPGPAPGPAPGPRPGPRPAPGPAPGPVNCKETCSYKAGYCVGAKPLCYFYKDEHKCIADDDCDWQENSDNTKCSKGYYCPESGCCDPTYFCPENWFPQDGLPYSENCKRCTNCPSYNEKTPVCDSYYFIVTKPGAWYQDSDAYIQTPEGGMIKVRINGICDMSGLCPRFNPRAVEGYAIVNSAGFKFNEEYVVLQDGHEERCLQYRVDLEDCQGKVKLMPGEDNQCENPYFCDEGFFPEDGLPHSKNCKLCNSCEQKDNTYACNPFYIKVTKPGASYMMQNANLQNRDGVLLPIKINATCDRGGLCQEPGHYKLTWVPPQGANPQDSLRDFEFNKEYLVVQDGHEERCQFNRVDLEDCQGKVKIMPGKDTVCK